MGERHDATTGCSIDLASGEITGIGSLPFDDVDEAFAHVLERLPHLPAVPSLPNRSPAEYLIAQGAAGLKGVQIRPDGSLLVDVDGLDLDDPFEELVPADSFGTMSAFLDRLPADTPWLKLQVVGPITLGNALVHAGVAANVAYCVADVAARARASALVDMVRAALPDTELVVFVDEPGLVALNDPHFALSPDQAVDLVSSTLAVLEPHAITGVHCCGPTDWRLIQEAGPQILSLPVEEWVADHASAIANQLERGGWIAWGVIPTDGPVSSEADVPWRHLGVLWCSLVSQGCDPTLLREQALFTPACGLGHHTPDQAGHVLQLTAEIGRRVQTQAFGLRLTIGA